MYPLKSITVGNHEIGEGHPCFIIAEAGVNHNGSLAMALKLVDAAAEAGVDAVKFQMRTLNQLYPEALLNDPNSAEWAFQYMLPILKQVELSNEDFQRIKDQCDKRNIRFLCTPWDEGSLTFLEQLDVAAYKVSSADLVNLPLLEKVLATGKPLILSTGMATIKEIDAAVDYLKTRSARFAILHCVSNYPAPFENLNLRFMETLKSYCVPVGYSSHERGIAMPLVALTLGACIIEKHITLDRSLPGPDHPASLEPGGMQKMVRDIRNAELAMGVNQKHISAMEMVNRHVLRKSLVAGTDLSKGTTITREMVKVKGPGKGLSPQRIEELIGKRLQRDMKADDVFTEADLQESGIVAVRAERFAKPWGFKARLHDFTNYLQYHPKIIELHFGEKDVAAPFAMPPRPYSQRLFLHAPEFADSKLLNMCSDQERVRTRAKASVQQTIDRAVELSAAFAGPVGIVIHVGGMSMDEPVSDVKPLLSAAIDTFSKLQSKGAVLLPENLPPRPWYLGGQWFQNVFTAPEHMTEFCNALHIGMTLDISHAQLYCNFAQRSMKEYIDICRPYVRHVHFGDASGIDGEGLQIGEGNVDWDEVMEALAAIDFTWVPEIWSGHLNANAGFMEAINRLAEFEGL